VHSRTTERFRTLRAALPQSLQEKASAAYALWSVNPAHPSLRFKKVHANLPVYSARIDRRHRAVGILNGDTVVWFWIGSHNDYEELLKGLRDAR
jgi:hypothetical protein